MIDYYNKNIDDEIQKTISLLNNQVIFFYKKIFNILIGKGRKYYK